jgi:hypothetical protein
MDEKVEFKGQSAEHVQRDFFLRELPNREIPGQYFYRTAGLRAEPGTVVLFQYAGRIIASALLRGTERFDVPREGYNGALFFDSIRVFNPVGVDVARRYWPDFTGFGRVKHALNPAAYREFERGLTGIEFAQRSRPEAQDMGPPPAESK